MRIDPYLFLYSVANKPSIQPTEAKP